MSAAESPLPGTVRVWDPLVRIGHWLLAASVLLAWLTRHSPGAWHEWIGYASLLIVAVRIVWGGFGSLHARFSDFIKGPRATLSYVAALVRGREPRTLGHNPLGGWMIVALLLTVALTGASGWLYTTDRFWGVEWVERVHAGLTNLLIGLVVLHLAGVFYASFSHRENLIAAMIHGRKKQSPWLNIIIVCAAVMLVQDLPLAADADPVEVWVVLSEPALSTLPRDANKERSAARRRIQRQQDDVMAQLAALGAVESARVLHSRNALAVRLPPAAVERAGKIKGVISIRRVTHRNQIGA